MNGCNYQMLDFLITLLSWKLLQKLKLLASYIYVRYIFLIYIDIDVNKIGLLSCLH